MSEFQLKITLHTKNQENLKLNLERQSIGVNGEVGKMLGLSSEDFKAAETGRKNVSEVLGMGLRGGAWAGSPVLGELKCWDAV